MEYQVRIYDPSRTLLAVLKPIGKSSYTKRLLDTTTIKVSIAKKSFAADYAQIAKYLEVWQGDKYKIGGRIENVKERNGVINLTAVTEEVLFSDIVMPENYSRVMQNWDLADFVRSLRYKRSIKRMTLKAHFETNTANSNIDLVTMPNAVILSETSGHYNPSGTIRFSFNSSDIPDFTSWERIRYLADNDQVVKVEIRTKQDAAAWSAWSTPNDSPRLGLYLNSTAANLQIEFQLTTTDTTSDGKGYTPALFAFEIISKTQEVVKISTIPASTGKIVSLNIDRANALSLIKQACKATGWEFIVREGKVYLAEKFGQSRLNEYVLHTQTNMKINNLSVEHMGFANEVIAYEKGSNALDRMTVTRRNVASINDYGITKTVTQEFGANDEAELIAKADAFLLEAANPARKYSIKVLQGFKDLDKLEFEVGDTVKLVDPQNEFTTTGRIIEEKRVLGTGEIELIVGGRQRTFADAIQDGIDKALPAPELKPPIGLRAQTMQGGILVTMNPFTGNTSHVEVYASLASGIEPFQNTLVATGQASKYRLTDLQANFRYYIKAVAVDRHGKKSEPTAEVSAVAGAIDAGNITGSLGPSVKIDGVAANILRKALGMSYTNGFEPSEFVDWEAQIGTTVNQNTDRLFASYSGLFTSTHVAPAVTEEPKVDIQKEIYQSWGTRTILISFYAKKPASNYSNEFAVAYQGSGWQRFTPSTSWQHFSFKYKLPARASDTADILAIWGDTSGSGNGVLIDGLNVALAQGGDVADLDLIEGQHVQDGTLEKAKFALDIRPPVTVAALPALPDAEYPNDSLIVLNGELWRNNAGTWTKAVPATDITGQLVNSQIDSVIASKITGQLTSAQIASLEAAKLTGQIVGTQITDNAITTPKLAAGSVIAGKLGVDSVAAENIIAKNVTIDKLTISNLNNLVPDSDFAAGDFSEWVKANNKLGQSIVPLSGSPTNNVMKWENGSGINTSCYSRQSSNRYIPVKEGQAYKIGLSVKRPSGTSNNFYVYIFHKNKDGSTGHGVKLNIPSGDMTTAWEHFTATYPVPSDVISVALYLQVYDITGALYWTNLSFIQMSTSELIVDGAIIAQHISAGAITADAIAANAINATHLSADSVTADALSANSVVAATVAAGAIGTTALAAEAVVSDKIAAGAIEADAIGANVINATHMAANSILAEAISSGAVTTDKLNALAVTAEKIATDAIISRTIKSDEILARHISSDAIEARHIKAGEIETDHLTARLITTAKLALEAVDATIIKAGSVETDHLTTGDIYITGSGRDNARLVVRDTSDVDQVVVGNIHGRSGVPSTAYYGLWGKAGTNVFIEGVPRLVTQVRHTVDTTISANGQSRATYSFGVVDLTVPDIVVPVGGKMIYTSQLAIMNVEEPYVLAKIYPLVMWDPGSSGSTTGYHNTTGSTVTLNNFKIGGDMEFYNPGVTAANGKTLYMELIFNFYILYDGV